MLRVPPFNHSNYERASQYQLPCNNQLHTQISERRPVVEMTGKRLGVKYHNKKKTVKKF